MFYNHWWPFAIECNIDASVKSWPRLKPCNTILYPSKLRIYNPLFLCCLMHHIQNIPNYISNCTPLPINYALECNCSGVMRVFRFQHLCNFHILALLYQLHCLLKSLLSTLFIYSAHTFKCDDMSHQR